MRGDECDDCDVRRGTPANRLLKGMCNNERNKTKSNLHYIYEKISVLIKCKNKKDNYLYGFIYFVPDTFVCCDRVLGVV